MSEREAERAAVVAWLRGLVRICQSIGTDSALTSAAVMTELAIALGHGDHISGGGEG